jgi:hypothetical protein
LFHIGAKLSDLLRVIDLFKVQYNTTPDRLCEFQEAFLMETKGPLEVSHVITDVAPIELKFRWELRPQKPSERHLLHIQVENDVC